MSSKTEKVLNHIAFIMDGNGRWAQKRGLPREMGHREGAKTFRKIVDLCGEKNLEAITFYAFSTENWKRPKTEIDAITTLFQKYLLDSFSEIVKNDVRIIFLGDRSVYSPKIQNIMNCVEQDSFNNHLILNIAVNYGGRQEIVRAANRAFSMKNTPITLEDISENLYTAQSGDPDLIIRTAGEMRISNFLLWQSAYSEFYFCDTLWPDFSEADLNLAIDSYFGRERRFGGILK